MKPVKSYFLSFLHFCSISLSLSMSVYMSISNVRDVKIGTQSILCVHYTRTSHEVTFKLLSRTTNQQHTHAQTHAHRHTFNTFLGDFCWILLRCSNWLGVFRNHATPSRRQFCYRLPGIRWWNTENVLNLMKYFDEKTAKLLNKFIMIFFFFWIFDVLP